MDFGDLGMRSKALEDRELRSKGALVLKVDGSLGQLALDVRRMASRVDIHWVVLERGSPLRCE